MHFALGDLVEKEIRSKTRATFTSDFSWLIFVHTAAAILFQIRQLRFHNNTLPEICVVPFVAHWWLLRSLPDWPSSH